jgi:gamma-glutamyltranspeptidase/glutathione hydrolase
MSFGVMGGDFQPQERTNLNEYDRLWDELTRSGDSPRFEHIGSSSVTGELALGQGVLMESGFDFEEIRKLMNKGHKVGFGGYYGGYQAIMYDAIKVYFGASESRKDGQASGY